MSRLRRGVFHRTNSTGPSTIYRTFFVYEWDTLKKWRSSIYLQINCRGGGGYGVWVSWMAIGFFSPNYFHERHATKGSPGASGAHTVPVRTTLGYQPLTRETEPALLPIYRGGTKAGPDRTAEMEPSTAGDETFVPDMLYFTVPITTRTAARAVS